MPGKSHTDLSGETHTVRLLKGSRMSGFSSCVASDVWFGTAPCEPTTKALCCIDGVQARLMDKTFSFHGSIVIPKTYTLDAILLAIINL
jgi:hypothetical protein